LGQPSWQQERKTDNRKIYDGSWPPPEVLRDLSLCYEPATVCVARSKYSIDMSESVQSVPKGHAVSCELRLAKEGYWHIPGAEFIDGSLRATICIAPDNAPKNITEPPEPLERDSSRHPDFSLLSRSWQAYERFFANRSMFGWFRIALQKKPRF
jgi:hypothetical protein